MTHGYAEWLQSQGVRVSEPRKWPLQWVTFRIHPCPHWPGVERFRKAIGEGRAIDPVILCHACYVILDGWHRVAAHWLEGKRFIDVRFADRHWMGGKECCRVDLTHWIQTLRPWSDLDCISGAYLESDWDEPMFIKLRDELAALGVGMPKMRFWEWVRAIIFLGNVRGKHILDVGSRESSVPNYLALKGAFVTSIDMSFTKRSIVTEIPGAGGVCSERGDAREMAYPSDSFDHVISTACVKHIPGQGDLDAVKEMVRVTKPGGLIAITTNYGQEYSEYPDPITKSRTYDGAALYDRLIWPSGADLQEPVGFGRVDWNAWPIKTHAKRVYEAGLNIQVAFILLRKPE